MTPSDTPKHRLWAPDNAEYMDVSDTPKRCGTCRSKYHGPVWDNDANQYCPDAFHELKPASPRQGEAEGEVRRWTIYVCPIHGLTGLDGMDECSYVDDQDRGCGYFPERVEVLEAHSVGEDDALAEVKRLRAEVQLAEARADRAERNAIDWGHRLERAEEKR